MTRPPVYLTRLVVVGAVTAWMAAAASAQSGSASLSGTVVQDGGDAHPVRRVSVTLTGSGLSSPRIAVTDDEGRFRFERIPAGHFTLTAARVGYVKAAFGSARGWKAPGTPIVVGDGQKIEGLTIQMLKGAVITGRITDQFGRPMADAGITIGEVKTIRGQPTLKAAPIIWTDDRGIYRAFGLPPGTYIVSASYSQGSARVLDAQPGTVPSSYAPSYFPGTPDYASASPVSVAAGEERDGIDFVVRPVPVATISGVVSSPPGAPVSGVMLYAVPAGGLAGTGPGLPLIGSTDAAGAFQIRGVPPGRYAIVAQVRSQANLFGGVDVEVAAPDLPGVAVLLQPGTPVSGRVVFEGHDGPLSADQQRTQIRLTPPRSFPGATITPQPAAIRADGTFVFTGVPPGPFLVTAQAQGASQPAGAASAATPDAAAWTVKSVTINGRATTSTPIDIQPGGPVTDIVVTLTDRAPEIHGRMIDQAGRPAPEYFVLAFPADRSQWGDATIGRPAAVRPASDGSYRIAGLVAGDYLVAALTEVEPDDHLDPAFLDLLVPSAVRITVANGEKKTLDLKIGK